MSRHIDHEQGVRTRPMKVLCLGMPRTGTMSLRAGLIELGYKPYHLADAMENPTRDLRFGIEAWKAKYLKKGKPYGREEFDKWLPDHDGTLDVPLAFLAEELIVAYPEAKIILSTRPVDKWLSSIDSTANAVLAWISWPILAYLDPIVGQWFSFGIMFLQVTGLDQRRFFNGHYETIRQLLEQRGEMDRMVEWEAKDGWAPICKLLGRDVPKTEFPHVNETADFVRWHTDFANQAWKRVGWRAVTRGVPLLVAGVGAWMYFGGWGRI